MSKIITLDVEDIRALAQERRRSAVPELELANATYYARRQEMGSREWLVAVGRVLEVELAARLVAGEGGEL